MGPPGQFWTRLDSPGSVGLWSGKDSLTAHTALHFSTTTRLRVGGFQEHPRVIWVSDSMRFSVIMKSLSRVVDKITSDNCKSLDKIGDGHGSRDSSSLGLH
jgi:hypothetical protein